MKTSVKTLVRLDGWDDMSIGEVTGWLRQNGISLVYPCREAGQVHLNVWRDECVKSDWPLTNSLSVFFHPDDKDIIALFNVRFGSWR